MTNDKHRVAPSMKIFITMLCKVTQSPLLLHFIAFVDQGNSWNIVINKVLTYNSVHSKTMNGSQPSEKTSQLTWVVSARKYALNKLSL